MNGREAVAKALADILAEHHRGSLWLPVERTKRGRCKATPGKVIRCLASPQDDAAGGDGGPPA